MMGLGPGFDPKKVALRKTATNPAIPSPKGGVPVLPLVQQQDLKNALKKKTPNPSSNTNTPPQEPKDQTTPKEEST